MSKVAQSPFVRVAIFRSGDSTPEHKAQESGVAQNGGVNPTWDGGFRRDFHFIVDDSDFRKYWKLYLSVKILAEINYFPHRPIGEASILLTELKESPTNDVTSYPLVMSTGGCLGRLTYRGTVSLTITIEPVVETPYPWYRPPVGTTSSGGSDMLPGMALGYAVG